MRGPEGEFHERRSAQQRRRRAPDRHSRPDRAGREPAPRPGFHLLLSDPVHGGDLHHRLFPGLVGGPSHLARRRRRASDGQRHQRAAPGLPAPSSGGHAAHLHQLPPAGLCAGGDAGRGRGRAGGPVRHGDARRGARRAAAAADPGGGAGGDDGQSGRRRGLCGADPAGRCDLRRRRTSPHRGHYGRLCGRVGRVLGQPSARPAGCAAVRHHRSHGGGPRSGLDDEYRGQLVFHRGDDLPLPAGDLVCHRPHRGAAPGQMDRRHGGGRRAQDRR